MLRLEGEIRLLAPLSHIGEVLGTDSYLAEHKIVGPDGRPVECFVYSGNAFRGQLRDLGTVYMLRKLGSPQISLEAFQLLFSGGTLSEEHSIDIAQARLYRKLIPLLAVLGGGVGNQILRGKACVGAMYPLCAECQHVLPERLRDPDAPSYRLWTQELSFTRMDDAKNESLRQYLLDPDRPALPKPEQQTFVAGEKKTEGRKEPKQQMRYTVECLAAGSRLYQRIDLLDCSQVELGAFVSCLAEFSRAPYLGGMSRMGFGLCEAQWMYLDLDTGETGHFVEVGREQRYLPGPRAAEAQQAYDRFLLDLYDRMLEAKGAEIKALLGARHETAEGNGADA